MKIMMITLAMLSIPALTGVSYAQTNLTVDSCQPLTAENKKACCNASNWRDIILPEAQASCTPGSEKNTQQQLNDDTVGSVTTPAETGSVSQPATGSADGNPGNSDTVGQSGEKGMNNESPSTGTKGNSN